MSPRKAAVLRGQDDGTSLREHLISTAEKMIARRGTAALTVREIAHEAGVADGVLYNHFDGKEDLLATAIAAYVRAVERDLGELPGPGTGDVASNVRAYIDYGLALHRAIVPAFAGVRGRPGVLSRFAGLLPPGTNWRDRLLGYLRAERDLGRLAPGAPVDAAAAMITGVCHETVLSLLLPDGSLPPIASEPPDIDGVVAVILGGIGT